MAVSRICMAVASAVIVVADICLSAHSQRAFPDQIAVVSEAFAGDRTAGCGAISVVDTVSDEPVLFRGASQPSLWRLAANVDFSVIVASAGSGNKNSIYRLRRSADPTNWQADRVRNRFNAFVSNGAVAVLDGGNTLVTSLGRSGETPPGIARIRMPSAVDAYVSADDIDAFGEQPSNVALQLLLSPDGQEIVSVSEQGEMFTHNVADLTRTRAPLAVPTLSIDPARPAIAGRDYFRAGLSPGGRYLIMAQAELPSLVVVDRAKESVTTVDVSTWLTMTGGVAINAGWQNRGLLAVSGGGRIAVFRFDPDGAFELLSAISIRPPVWAADASRTGSGPIAWSGDGQRLIAGINSGTDDFAILEVTECGHHIELVRQMAICASDVNLPADVITANGHIPTPIGFEAACPAPVWSDDYTPGPHQISTATPTTLPVLAYSIVLPALLRE